MSTSTSVARAQSDTISSVTLQKSRLSRTECWALTIQNAWHGEAEKVHDLVDCSGDTVADEEYVVAGATIHATVYDFASLSPEQRRLPPGDACRRVCVSVERQHMSLRSKAE